MVSVCLCTERSPRFVSLSGQITKMLLAEAVNFTGDQFTMCFLTMVPSAMQNYSRHYFPLKNKILTSKEL